jgi:hypothetical protein
MTDTTFGEDIGAPYLHVMRERHLICRANPEKQTGQHVLGCSDRGWRYLAINGYPHCQSRGTPVPHYDRSSHPKTHKCF